MQRNLDLLKNVNIVHLKTTAMILSTDHACEEPSQDISLSATEESQYKHAQFRLA